MKSLTRIFIVTSCLCNIAAPSACAGGDHEQQDAPRDLVAEDIDLGLDDTLPADAADIATDLDVVPDPLPDTSVDPDGMEIGTDAADATEDSECTGGVTGDPCSSVTQCSCVPSGARECLTTAIPYLTFGGGYCSARCSSTAECGMGATCSEVFGGQFYCFKVCSSAAQCRMVEGYVCTTLPIMGDTRTYCLP